MRGDVQKGAVHRLRQDGGCSRHHHLRQRRFEREPQEAVQKVKEYLDAIRTGEKFIYYLYYEFEGEEMLASPCV